MTEWRDDDLDARLWEGQGGEQIAGDALEPSTCNAAKEAVSRCASKKSDLESAAQHTQNLQKDNTHFVSID